jgi:hypothetical protein
VLVRTEANGLAAFFGIRAVCDLGGQGDVALLVAQVGGLRIGERANRSGKLCP